MTRRYVTAWWPRGEWADEPLREMGLTVTEPDRQPVRTGLFDKQGNELVAIDIPNPIGFLAKIEDEQ